MKIYCVYMTIYLGNKMPPFYIGSTSVENIKKGYKGSVSSSKWKQIWKEEVRNNPHLFRTWIIPNQYKKDKNEILELERKWQEIFDVVENYLFINLSYANKGFFTTQESARKTVETRRKNGNDKPSIDTRNKLSMAKSRDKNPMYGKVVWKEAGLQNPMTGRKHTLESKKKDERCLC